MFLISSGCADDDALSGFCPLECYAVEGVESGRWKRGYPEETVEYHKAVLEWKETYESMGL